MASRTYWRFGFSVFVTCFLIGGFLLVIAPPPQLWGQLATSDHLADPGFWPTKAGRSRGDYVGREVCEDCHSTIVAQQDTTPMAHAAMYADTADILHKHPNLNFAVGPYRYHIQTDAKQSVYTVMDGTQTLRGILLWAFGTGRVGQSYLFKKDDGQFYEARVTFFQSLQALNFTPSRALAHPKDIEEAMDRPVDSSEISRCFACHTTASNVGDHFDEKNLILGVSCEACHGPGAKHVAAVQARIAGKPVQTHGTIFNPAHLDPVDSVDFCGACHATWWDVKLTGVTGVNTARAPPYRLETSKCWRNGDARLTCIACHDPHVPLQTNPASYDKNCLSCHAASIGMKKTALRPGAACPVSQHRCVSCHMQKVFVPEMQDTFTDHRIRIVRAGAPFPE